MARGLPLYNQSGGGSDDDESVINAARPASIIHIDAKSGQTTEERPDGTVVLGLQGLFNNRRQSRQRRQFDENLAENPEVPVDSIASMLLEGIESDESSRREWQETANNGRDLLGITLEKITSQATPEGTLSKVKALAYLEAIIRSWANSRSELLPSGGPVKVADDTPIPAMGHNGGPPLDQQGDPAEMQQPTRDEIANALENDMNHYLTVMDREYVPDFSRMLLNRAVNGVQFRKVYRCPIERRPISRWTKGDDLIVSNDCSHLSGAGRITERIRMRQALAKRMMAVGAWRKIHLAQPSNVVSAAEQNIGEIEGVQPTPSLPQDWRHLFLECYCELDDGILAEDENGKLVGYPLPYRVTIEKDSRTVVEIRRNWKKGDPDFRRRRRYVKYGFVPGLGFYDLGFVHILGNSQRAATAIERQVIDAGSFASFPGWVAAKSVATRLKSNLIRPNPGEVVVVETGGLKISDVIMPLPYKEPSAALQNMGSKLDTDMRRVAGVLEIPVAEGRVGNVPVGTMMAYVDAISKVPSAVHKDDHAAQAEEFELLRELIAEEPEVLTRGNKRPARQNYTTEELEDAELVPKADPNTPSQTHRLMQTAALSEAASLPQFAGIADNRALWEDICRALGRNPDEITLPPQAPQPPPPPPQVIVAQIKSQDNTNKLNADLQKNRDNNDAQAMEAMQEADDKQADRVSEETRAGLKLAGDAVKAHVAHVGNVVAAAQDHAEHLNELGQADKHHAEDQAAAAAQPTTPTEGSQS